MVFRIGHFFPWLFRNSIQLCFQLETYVRSHFMKTSKKHISNTSFVVSLIRLFVVHYQKQATVKAEVFILFVGLCILMRYSIIAPEINAGRHNTRVSVTLKNLNLPVWPAEMIIKSNLYNYKLYQQQKVKNLNHKLDKAGLSLNKID